MCATFKSGLLVGHPKAHKDDLLVHLHHQLTEAETVVSVLMGRLFLDARLPAECLPVSNVRGAEIVAKHPHRPNLIGRLKGSRPGPTLMLCGHSDTKPGR